MEYNYEGEEFLNRIYKDLYKSSEVEHVSDKKDSKEEAIRKYLERLKRVEEKAKISKYNGYELLKEMYYERYIIKKENIKEEYFEHQKQIALERGYGHITITDENKEQMKEEVITNQKKSLDMWLDYFVNENETYPEWYKYYAFQGMVRLGSYDKKRGAYNKRTETTVNDYPELNREALALIYENLNKVIKGSEVQDEVLNRLIENGSFSKLYSYMITALNEVKKEIKGNEGIWKKYEQGSEPDELVESLQGRGTGWCTAGIEVARGQLNKGDFYVYYTKDNEGAYVQPRIAIRMEGNEIGEIRGIGEHQNLEAEMEEVLDKKLEEFPDKEKYKKKVSDMEKLTKIYNEYKERDITEEEIRFLYEIDDKIEGFGYSKDPRIDEILSTRYFKEDLSRALNIKEEEISNNRNDILREKKIAYYYGDLILGDLIIGRILEWIVLPNMVSGDLELRGLTSAEGLKLPDKIGGTLDLYSLESAEGLKFPDKIGGSLILSSIESVKGLVLPNEIGRDLDLSSLTSAEGLVLPSKIGGSLYLSSLTSAEGLKFPDKIDGYIDLSCLESARGLKLPNEIDDSLNLYGLKTAEGLVLPNKIGGRLYLSSLTSAKGLVLPNEIGWSLDLSSLESAEGLVLPNKIGGSLDLSSLESAEGLVLPNEIGGDLDLSSLTSVEGLKLPDKIGGNIYLNDSINIENTILQAKSR